MPQFTILIALGLVALGVGSYFGTGRVSHTALIPAYFGLALGIAGVLALKPAMRKHAMHAAAALGLLGLLGSGGRVLPKLFSAEGALSPANKAQLAMAGICLLFVAACVASFINARRSGKLSAPPEAS